MKLWLWQNFVDGKPEYWAFDNPFPVHLDCGDPQTLGEPCGYAIVKVSLNGRPDVPEEEVLRRIAASRPAMDGLRHGVLELLRSYRLTMTQDDEGNSYPLVDAVTPPGDAAITRGIEELEYLAEDIVDLASKLK